MESSSQRPVLSFFHIVMINVIAVDSIRTLPFAAEFGFSLVFYYLLAGIFFFVPSALVSAELGTGWPHRGGLYVWVREAFGSKFASVIIWINWVYNLAWYPTIMALVTATVAYLFDPNLSQNRIYMATVILSLFWLFTYLNCKGMRISSMISTFGAIVGTLLPMAMIIILAIIWLSLGHSSEIIVSTETFFPSGEAVSNLGFFSNVLFGLLGLEMVATHAKEMKNPQKDYPKALLVSVVIILTSIVLSSLAIALVVPKSGLNLVTGTLQAFSVFCNALHVPWLLPIIALCIFFGGLSGVSAWMVGPTKGIMVASMDGHFPKYLTKANKYGAPEGALKIQAIIVSILSLVFVFMPSVNSSFWLLSIITAQLALIVYISLFAAAIKLHHRNPEVKRPFRIPGKSFGIWFVSLCGIGVALFAIAVGFIPPEKSGISNLLLYEALIVFGMIFLIFIPYVLTKLIKRSSKELI